MRACIETFVRLVVVLCCIACIQPITCSQEARLLAPVPVNEPSESRKRVSTGESFRTPHQVKLASASEPREDEDPQARIQRLENLLEIQQEQLQTLYELTNRVAQEVEESGLPTTLGDSKIAKLEKRLELAAFRDQEVASEIDRINESHDSFRRNLTSFIPANLKETYLPSRADQSPLVIYNTLQFNIEDFESENRDFAAPVWLPHFYLNLKDEFQVQINPLITEDKLNILSAQVDWFLTDHLTLTAGRFYSPLGFFHERLHTNWVVKTPDAPLVFEQIYPFLLSFNGLQGRGARYLGRSHYKLEYSFLTANGLSQDVENPSQFDFANLNKFRQFKDVNNDLAFAGRVGLTNPVAGWTVGLSGLANGAYDSAGDEDLSMWNVDASFHRGNWDFRFEYANVNQQSPFGPIDRQGMYAQLAFRPRHLVHPVWSRLEYVGRLGWVDFSGIDLAQTGTDFGGSEKIPVNRNRYSAGVNAYLQPSLITKIHYQINDERDANFRFDDDGLIAQVVWGF
ncbi:MAG: hypothetical protein ACE361_25410 [Aureliella sp.]